MPEFDQHFVSNLEWHVRGGRVQRKQASTRADGGNFDDSPTTLRARRRVGPSTADGRCVDALLPLASEGSLFLSDVQSMSLPSLTALCSSLVRNAVLIIYTCRTRIGTQQPLAASTGHSTSVIE